MLLELSEGVEGEVAGGAVVLAWGQLVQGVGQWRILTRTLLPALPPEGVLDWENSSGGLGEGLEEGWEGKVVKGFEGTVEGLVESVGGLEKMEGGLVVMVGGFTVGWVGVGEETTARMLSFSLHLLVISSRSPFSTPPMLLAILPLWPFPCRCMSICSWEGAPTCTGGGGGGGGGGRGLYSAPLFSIPPSTLLANILFL